MKQTVITVLLFWCAVIPALSRAEENPQEQITCENRLNDFVTPNENHEFLRSFEGRWSAKFTFRLGPQMPYRTFDAVVESRMIMQGRYLEQNFKGVDKNYEAKQTYGYNNMRREFTSSWVDNMSTGMVTTAGQYDPKTKMLSEEGSMSCPITDQPQCWFRAVTYIKDNDHRTYETIRRDEEGEEYSWMIVEFARIP